MFYLTEQKLFHMLNEQCQCLYSSGDDELKYSEFKNQHGTVLNKPPRFVHWIGHLKGDADEIKERAALMRNDYVRAVGEKKFTKYPSRFPVFYSNVEQINVTQHRAYSSVRVEGEYVTVKTYTDVKDIPPDLEKLRAAGSPRKSSMKCYLNPWLFLLLNFMNWPGLIAYRRDDRPASSTAPRFAMWGNHGMSVPCLV